MIKNMDSLPPSPRAWSSFRMRALAVSVVTVSMLGAYVGVSLARSAMAPTATARRAPHGPPVNPFAAANGTHLIAFVVTASDCGWSNSPDVMAAIRTLRSTLKSTHGSSYAQVSVVGVALDRDINTGMKFLTKIGNGEPSRAFDQVSIGSSWLNEQVVRFVWREHLVSAASPQVILIERSVRTDAYLATSTISVQDDRIVGSFTGDREILAWLKAGAPVVKSTVAVVPSATSN